MKDNCHEWCSFHYYNTYFTKKAHCVRLTKIDKTHEHVKRLIKTHNNMRDCKLQLKIIRYGNTSENWQYTHQIDNKSSEVSSIFFTEKSTDHISQDSKISNQPIYIEVYHIYKKIINYHLNKRSKLVPKSYYDLMQEMRLILKI